MRTIVPTIPRWLLLAASCTAYVATFGSMAYAENASGGSARTWPMCDGEETVEAYALRAGLPPTRTLDLGDGVMLDLVLIPAGKFVMGTPLPSPVGEEDFREKVVVGRAALNEPDDMRARPEGCVGYPSVDVGVSFI